MTPKAGSGQDRTRTAPPLLLAGLMGLTVVAGLWYLLSVAGLTVTRYEIPWVAHGAAVWLAVNGAFLLLATARIRQLRFAGSRRSAWRFGVDLPLAVRRADRSDPVDLRATLADVSVDGARLVVPLVDVALDGLRPGTRLALDLPTAPARTVTVPATIRSVGADQVEGTMSVGVAFDLPTTDAGVVALALHRVPAAGAVPAPRSPSSALAPVVATTG